MNQYIFLKLQELIKGCDYKQICGYEFIYDRLTDGYTSAIFTIKKMQNVEDYNIIIEDGVVKLGQGDFGYIAINNEDADQWLILAEELFQETYACEIDEMEKHDAENNWQDYQDTLGKEYRYAY